MTDDVGIGEVVAFVGEARFLEACAWAWRTAAGTGFRSQGRVEWPDDLKQVPHDAEEIVWTGERPGLEEVALAFALYRRMPCYANLMYIGVGLSDGSRGEPAKALFWREYRDLVSDPDDRLADPVSYSLWCDYYEDPDDVREAWSETALHPETSQRGLERILNNSGPVPFPFKASLYEQLIAEPRWHYFIYLSLLHSRFDYFGKIDLEAARHFLSRLQLPADTEDLDVLTQGLASNS